MYSGILTSRDTASLWYNRLFINNQASARSEAQFGNGLGVKQIKYQQKWIGCVLVAATLITGCDIGIEDPDGNESGGTSDTSATATGGNNTQTDTTPTSGTTSTGGSNTQADDTSTGGTTTPAPTDGNYSLSLPIQTVNLTEGSSVSVDIQIQRNNGYDGQVTFGAEAPTQSDGAQLNWAFTSTRIAGNENSTSVNLTLDFAVLPIQPQTRTVRILATDGNTQRSTDLNINVTPTDLSDVYLLIGQSNMVGASEENAKRAEVAGDDAPVDSVLQLNVTGNDQQNFDTPESFTSDDAIAVSGQLFTPAVDPLHDGYNSNIKGKAGTRVGLGLSFGKRAIANTTASEIYLVPAAWEDTGFCRRDRTQTPLAMFEGSLGWNATPTSNPELSGTLLYKRAIARTNLTLQKTNGILRGILWHQGEADAESAACANVYEQQLVEMVASLRTNIIEDARGPSARGPNANVPFVVGTMSKGFPYDNPTNPRIIVDTVHRNINSGIVPFSAFVNNDDLIPPDFPCGDGGCIHFGSGAYRQMGSDYYDQLREAAVGQ